MFVYKFLTDILLKQYIVLYSFLLSNLTSVNAFYNMKLYRKKRSMSRPYRKILYIYTHFPHLMIQVRPSMQFPTPSVFSSLIIASHVSSNGQYCRHNQCCCCPSHCIVPNRLTSQPQLDSTELGLNGLQKEILSHGPHTPVLLWLGGDVGDASDFVNLVHSSEHTMSDFFNRTAALLRDKGMKGVHIDWKYPG